MSENKQSPDNLGPQRSLQIPSRFVGPVPSLSCGVRMPLSSNVEHQNQNQGEISNQAFSQRQRQQHFDFRSPSPISLPRAMGMRQEFHGQSPLVGNVREFVSNTSPVVIRTQPRATSTPQSAGLGVYQPGSDGSVVIASKTPTPSFCVLPGGSQGSSSRSMGRRPPETPPSNFNIQAPDISSESSDDSSSDDENVLPLGCGIVGRLRDITRRRWQSLDEESIQEGRSSSLGGRALDSVIGENGSVHSAAIRRRRQLLEGRADEGPKDVVLCVLWAATRFAASYYDLETGQLFMLPDISDAAPQFTILRSVFSQVNPTYVLVNKSSDDRFLKVIYELTGHRLVADSGNEDDSINEPPVRTSTQTSSIQLYQLPSKEYVMDTCKPRVLSLQPPFEPPNLESAEHVMFLSSLIPFANEVMIRTMGCLLKFLDKSAIELFQLEVVRGHIQVSDVILFKMDDIVLVDDSAWRSLQIFSVDFHPSSFKQGSASGTKEGLSVYSILNRCVTIQGAKTLRLMLLRPTRNRNTLTRRYDVVDYCAKTSSLEFVTAVKDCLKSVKNIPKLLHRLSLLHATVSEWKQLYQTLYHCLLLMEHCHSLEDVPELISDMGNPEFLGTLRLLTQEMMRVIDFEQSDTSSRIVAKEGLDPELDRKKKQYACLPEIMSIVASEEIAELPNYVSQCCAVYIPEVGYLLAVSLWRPNLSEAELQIENLEYRFKTHELAYYKSPRMRELDVVLGDCSVAILEKETIMMIRLTELILQKSSTLQRISDLVSELDCLTAISAIAKSNNFVRPIPVTSEEKLKIVEGRHPISDMLCEFVPNSTIFKGQERVVVLTGPNASGKSVYLKQIGVIVIMALSGSFVPASFAQIPLFDKICTRVHAVESVSSGFSSFMVDINQMSLAIRSSTRNTLVIVDEFGKGTLEADGLSILTASIQAFIDRGVNCPTIFLSTHFSSMTKYLRESPLVKYQSMKFLDVNGTITYLYELIDGNCETSFAAMLAKDQGIPLHVVERAIQMENVTRQTTTSVIQSITSQEQIQREDAVIKMADEFLQLNLAEVNPVGYLRLFKSNIDLLYTDKEKDTVVNE